ncbi:hypothetical protein [Polaromonas sp.]
MADTPVCSVGQNAKNVKREWLDKAAPSPVLNATLINKKSKS